MCVCVGGGGGLARQIHPNSAGAVSRRRNSYHINSFVMRWGVALPVHARLTTFIILTAVSEDH